MDEGLFKKHILRIQVHKEGKEEMAIFLKEKTGIDFLDEEFSLSKKIVSFTVTSVKKNILCKKRIIELLQEKGYSVKL